MSRLSCSREATTCKLTDLASTKLVGHSKDHGAKTCAIASMTTYGAAYTAYSVTLRYGSCGPMWRSVPGLIIVIYRMRVSGTGRRACDVWWVRWGLFVGTWECCLVGGV